MSNDARRPAKRGPYATNDPLGRRTWAEVARDFARLTGRPISEQACTRTCVRAERKIREALYEMGITPEVLS